MTLGGRCLGGPFDFIQELWRSHLESEMLHAIQEWCEIGEDKLPEYSGKNANPQSFAEVFQLLSSLIPYLKIPPGYDSLVLHHPDIALRNVLFDKESLSSYQPKITGLIDWGGAQILPLMLTGHFPDDLISSGWEPFNHPAYHLHESWNSVPFDWTSIGEAKKWPISWRAHNEPIDYTPSATAMVRRFYLRTYFRACYAEQMHLLHGDTKLQHAMLFADAPYYLKFHEMICGGWMAWVDHAEWIRETYRRLRTLGEKAKAGDLLITGPNVYRGSVEAALCDLRIFEDPLPVDDDSEDYI